MDDLSGEPESGLTTKARILIGLAVIAVVLVAGHILNEQHNGLGVLVVSISGIAALVMLACIPLVLAGFVWRFVVRRIYRVRHIRQKEMERLIREAAKRGPDPAQKR